MQLDDFVLLRRHARNRKVVDESIEALLDGIAAGGIRNAVMTDCKFYIARAVEEAWEQHVKKPFINGKWDALDQDVKDLDMAIMLMSLHDVLAAAKKVSKSTATGPAVDAMREFMAEVHPLALGAASMKDKLIMGRAPSTSPPKDVNPDKIVKTCACCFREIAVVSTYMAKHGYKRPGTGSQTSSCPGIKFRPLEVSSEGLAHITRLTKVQLESTETALAGLPTRATISVLARNAFGNRELVTLTQGDQKFEREAARLKDGWEWEIKCLKGDLTKLEPMLKNWTQTWFPEWAPTAAATNHEPQTGTPDQAVDDESSDEQERARFPADR